MKLISNKNITSLLTLTSCLVVLSSSAPCLASYTSLPEGSFLSSSTSTVQSSDKKSIGEFMEVLGKRLSGVWQEVWGLIGDAGGTTGSSLSSISTVLVDDLFSGNQQLATYFSDIATHPHAYFINLLAKEGIVVGQQGKFYPDNYLRLYDLIKMSVDLYRSKVGYALTGEQGLVQEGAFSGDMSLPSRYVATALHLGFLSHIPAGYTDMQGVERFVSSQDISQLFTNIGYEFSGMVRNLSLEIQETVTRGQVATYLVMAFDLTPDGFTARYQGDQSSIKTPFLDIFGNPYQVAISTLAQLGIVDTATSKFYPDNDLHRYDFIIMLVNSLLYSQHQVLDVRYLSGYVSPFVDVSRDQTYAPFIYYAGNQGLLDYLIVNKRQQDYIFPDAMMTKHEIYTVLSKALGTKFVYDSAEADKSYMTRGEFAQLLVDSFGFIPPKQETAFSVPGTGNESALQVLVQLKELLSKI